MVVSKNFYRSCMWFGALKQAQKLPGLEREHPKITIREANINGKRKLAELLFEHCRDCAKMSVLPQAAFAVCKVRRNLERDDMITPMEEREKAGKEIKFNMRPPLEGWEVTPLKYNSKLMNSIWGLYNRYSVHNFKKNNSNEGVFGSFEAAWDAIAPAANSTATTAVAKNTQ